MSSKSGIIRANRTAAEILGVKPEEIAGFDWRSLFHDNPDAQRRLREVLKLVQSGNEARGEELELRRKEDGRPLAVRWWSKSEAGNYSRIMFIDITEQVLLEQENRRLEERFRDYFEEAPIAYVVGSEAGIIRANRTAAQIFGIKPDNMTGFDWRSLFPHTPDAQRRLREALRLVESGTEAHGERLELRRKEDGRSIWVKWWSKREARQYARIMFLDMTDQVLMEQEKARS